jgi:protein TonB
VSEITFPLGLSVAGHAVCLALLILLLPTRTPPPEPLPVGGIEVAFEPPVPKPEEPPVHAETPPPPVEPPPPEPEPPPPEEPVAAPEPPPPIEAPAPVVEPPLPPTPRKPVVKPPAKAVRQVEKPQPSPAPVAAQPAPAAPQTAYAPAPAPAPVPSAEVSPGYRALLSAWLESHKRYPDAARQRGAEGRAVLRFAIDRGGRVLDFAVAQSTGHPDLDASLEEMMRGAVLPPFPAGMTQPRIDVSVTIRFSLAR